MDYFEFYDIPVQFYLDEQQLKKLFFTKSKSLHPDLHVQADQATQETNLLLSSLNTEAYKVLSDFYSRIEYILKMKGVLVDGHSELPKSFLMEMMELNEKIMDLQFDFSAEILDQCRKELHDFETKALEEVHHLLENYKDEKVSKEDLEPVKIFYLKHKYFLRIQKSLSTFAAH